MGKSQSEGGASTYIYGLIFVLYAGIAVVLFIYMMHKRYLMYFKQQSRKVLWVVGRPITFFLVRPRMATDLKKKSNT